MARTTGQLGTTPGIHWTWTKAVTDVGLRTLERNHGIDSPEWLRAAMKTCGPVLEVIDGKLTRHHPRWVALRAYCGDPLVWKMQDLRGLAALPSWTCKTCRGDGQHPQKLQHPCPNSDCFRGEIMLDAWANGIRDLCQGWDVRCEWACTACEGFGVTPIGNSITGRSPAVGARPCGACRGSLRRSATLLADEWVPVWCAWVVARACLPTHEAGWHRGDLAYETIEAAHRWLGAPTETHMRQWTSFGYLGINWMVQPKMALSETLIAATPVLGEACRRCNGRGHETTWNGDHVDCASRRCLRVRGRIPSSAGVREALRQGIETKGSLL